jgi:3-oxoacyl-[acyl-carrier protein] reductase
MSKYDDIRVGDSAELTHVISAADLERFVELTGDDNLLHTNNEYAAKTSFKKPVAHGMLGASFISTIIGTKLPGDGSLWFSQNLEFLLPVRVGDELTVRAEVLGKIDHMQAIELRTDVFNQHRQKVTTGVAKVKIVEPEATTEQPPARTPRVALVIGGSGDIGRAVCHALAEDGFCIAVHYFSHSAPAKSIVDDIVSKQGSACSFSADIGNDNQVEEMVKAVIRKFGTITALVNCASAKIASVSLTNLIWQDFEDHLSLSVRGSFNLVRQVAPIMMAAGYGKIIQIGSQAVESPSADWLPYITAKSAMVGFNRALAMELAPKGVCVNSVSPGMTDTEMIADIPERVRLLTAARTPLRRLARPEDVAGAVAFLASPRADYLTGETIRVNGGQVMI